MKKELNPMIVWGALVVVLLVVVVVGYRMLAGPGFKEEKKGSEADMERVKKGEAFYQPPADAPVPKPGGAGGGGGYNLTPPTR